MSTSTTLVTVAEFERLPDPPGGYYELHHGEVVKVTFPVNRHRWAQRRLLFLLEPLVRSFGLVSMEVAFRALPEHELRAADVAVVSWARHHASDPDNYLLGAPELVIEVLSPSNTFAEIHDKAQLCLHNGTREFWVVNLTKEQVVVMTADGPPRTYSKHDQVPLRFLGDASLPAARIFEDWEELHPDWSLGQPGLE